jgi:hypothetical protein
MASLFTFQSKMGRIIGGNQFHGRGLDVYVMKIESTIVEMFCFAKMMLLSTDIEEECRVISKSDQILKSQPMKKILYGGN